MGRASRKRLKERKKSGAPYGWTLLPRMAVFCCAPTLVVGLVLAAQHALGGHFLDNATAHREAWAIAALVLTGLFAIGTVLASIVVRWRQWSDAVVAVVLCVLIGTLATILVGYRFTGPR